MAFDLLESGNADLIALHQGERTLTRGELAIASRRAASFLHELGVRRGDTVAVWLPDGAVWMQLFFAAAQLGALIVPVSTRFRLQEALHVVKTANARVLVAPQRFLDFDYAGAANEIKASCDQLQRVVEVSQFDAPGWAGFEPYPGWEGRDTDLLCTFLTSGTTGAPKLAVHTAGGIARHARNVGAINEMRVSDVVLCALPLYGVLGFVQAIAALAAGAACVLLPVFKADAAAAAIERHRVTHFFGSDAMFDMVLNAGDYSLASWRRGAFPEYAGLGKSVIAKAWAAWGVRLTGLYGMSECFAMTAMRDAEGDAEQRAVPGGTPISPEIAFRIVDPASGAQLPDRQQGELQLRGYNVMSGYLNNPVATASAFTADGWFRTGDLAYADGRAFCYVGRIRDSLRLRGYLVDPAEIENFLAQHPGVLAAQVVGVHVDGEGDVAVAFVLGSTTPVTEDELIAWCKQGIAGFKVPRRIVTIDAFPQRDGPNGVKILKNVLRDMASQCLGLAQTL
ncbi:putative acid--CoA ligase [Paraburkholderia piptadeniae]|uniref:Acid--CoA ligase n=1 Tax=Paraburkholderia piptadeniae TaxID=1701573 RepID=A0A1N7SGV7_9BURK|nr:AMP-binding protein [Paraburkholderia piptadeniae]SIT46648.1 putative acid--CoA ligase [Paraburkholderia piptadeniae]